jgi:hypothetical protein
VAVHCYLNTVRLRHGMKIDTEERGYRPKCVPIYAKSPKHSAKRIGNGRVSVQRSNRFGCQLLPTRQRTYEGVLRLFACNPRDDPKIGLRENRPTTAPLTRRPVAPLTR